jgi:hypothetical protein
MSHSNQKTTPWNPSKYAIKRVGNPLPSPTVCPHCGNEVKIVGNEVIYGKPFGKWPWAYRCVNDACDSFVGMHPETNIPLGTLANAEIRKARKLTKELFQKLWTDGGKMTRDEAYLWMSGELKIPAAECHFGWFDVPTCRKAYAALKGRISASA